MLLKFQNTGKEYDGKWLLRNLSVQLNPGDRVGLIGRNGAGKTTLFNLIEGAVAPDAGQVVRSSQLSLSRVEQIPRIQPDRTLLEETILVFSQMRAMEDRMRDLEARMASSGLDPEIAERYEHLRSRFEMEGGYDYPARTERVLFGLGFEAEDLARPCSHLSGGQRSRLSLARALLRPARLLLLDEPTNHLDLDGILWLTEFLREGEKSFILISHDREFLDEVTLRTWELERGSLHDYPAGYSGSRRLREERRRLQKLEYERQQEWRRRTEQFIQKNIVGQKTKQAQSRRKQLERADWVDDVEQDGTRLKISIPEAPRGGHTVVEIENGVVGYPGNPLIRALDLTIYRGERVGFLGSNGTGKTSLLQSIRGEVPLLEGRFNWGANNLPVFYDQEPDPGDPDSLVLEAIAELNPYWSDERLRGFAAAFGFRGEEVEKRVESLSGGERSRLSLARLFARPANVLFLDEPTNHLDIQSREALEEALNRFDGTIVVVSHDLYFLRRTVEKFFLIRDERLQELDQLERLHEEYREPAAPSRPKGRPAEKRSSRGTEREVLSKNERMRLSQRISQIESSIEELEGEKEEIAETIQAGLDDPSRYASLAGRLEEIESSLASLYREWEEMGAVLES